MSISLVRVDDRLIHGQVVVGWVQALAVNRIVLVDDAVATNEWEQELYALGVPPGVEVVFTSVADAVEQFSRWNGSGDRVIVLVGDVDTAARLSGAVPEITTINLGGIHDATGRRERLSYVYLSDVEAHALQTLTERGIAVTAQDVPTARKVPLEEMV